MNKYFNLKPGDVLCDSNEEFFSVFIILNVEKIDYSYFNSWINCYIIGSMNIVKKKLINTSFENCKDLQHKNYHETIKRIFELEIKS